MKLNKGDKVIVQLLFSAGESFTIDSLRLKLRELTVSEANVDMRTIASFTTEALVSRLLEISGELQKAGLKIRIYNGTVELLAGPVECSALSTLLHDTMLTNPKTITDTNLEVLACIAFKQPISQAEIDKIFDADRRWQTARLEALEMIEHTTDKNGHKRYITTASFNNKYGSPEELKQALENQSMQTEKYG